MKKIIKILKINIVFISIVFISGCYSAESLGPLCTIENKQTVLTINNLKLNTEIACSYEDKAQGLMNRTSLDTYSAMLFVYPREEILGFWMKNTYIPLSIAYINSQGNIVDIQNMQPLDETPVISSEKAKYALEVNQGLFDKYNIKIGDSVFEIKN